MASPEVMQVETSHTHQGAQDLGRGISVMPSKYSRYADTLREMQKQKLLARFMKDEDRIQKTRSSFCTTHSDIEAEEALRSELSKAYMCLHVYY